MYPTNFDYVRANSVQEAIGYLKDRQDAKLLAGGHSLIPLLKLHSTSVGTLVDIGRISSLKGISLSDGSVIIGPLTTHAGLAASNDIPAALREAAANVGDLQVRNRGTIGGNVAHADPASDYPTILVALNANFDFEGPYGKRVMPASGFFRGLFETMLGKQDVLTAIEIATEKRGTGSAYVKMSHLASGYALLGAAATLTVVDGRCTAAGVAIGGLTPKATRLPSVEAALIGKTLEIANLGSAAEAIQDDLGDDLLGDFYTSAEYRKAMAPIYVQRALKAATQRAVL